MSTRAGVGFRFNGTDHLMYHNSDGGMGFLGKKILKFCREYDSDKMRQRVAKFVNVGDRAPTVAQIRKAGPLVGLDAERIETFVSRVPSKEDRPSWDDLLDVDGRDLHLFMEGLNYWPDYDGFLRSFDCEWGYIINLDTDALEVYTGRYNASDHETKFYATLKPTGRYATVMHDPDNPRYSRGVTLIDEIPLEAIREIPQMALDRFCDRLHRQF